MGKVALIVADMLRDFMEPQGTLYLGDAARGIIPFVAQKIEETRAAGGLVIYACDAHAPDDKEFQFFAPHAVKGTPGAQIIPELKVLPGDYRVAKTTYSCFHNTEMDAILKREQVARVEIVGVCTSICVQETVKELFDREIPCRVYRQGVADFDPEAHAAALKYMEHVLGAEVV